VTSCPPNTYPNLTINSCNSCNITCGTCTGPLACETCKSGFFLSGTECLPCDTSCLTCNGVASNNCLTCTSGSYLINELNTCSTCTTTQYFDQTKQLCIFICSANQYYDEISQICQNCDISCETCKGISRNCTSCSPNSLLKITSNFGTCIDNCTSNQYLSDYTCFPCDIRCSGCLGPSNSNCTACSSDYFLNISTNQCTNLCPLISQYYDKSLKTCKDCNNTCLTCSGPAYNQCLSCFPAFYYFPSATTCGSICPILGYYIKNNLCETCDSTCKTCKGSLNTNCLSCFSNLYLVNGTCVKIFVNLF